MDNGIDNHRLTKSYIGNNGNIESKTERAKLYDTKNNGSGNAGGREVIDLDQYFLID